MYDFAIIGLGAAGAQLALAMCEDPYFNNKQILILEKEETVTNDKRWSYWQKGDSKFDPLVTQQWHQGAFIGPTGSHQELKLAPYSYKSINSKDFFEYAYEKLNKQPSVTIIYDSVEQVIKDTHTHLLKGIHNEYKSRVCFDSRIDNPIPTQMEKSVMLWQHFKGWHIKCTKEVFHPDRFIMMDFSYRHTDTSFIYVLPYSKNEALIECTAFTSEVYKDDKQYESLIKKYLADLAVSDYEIVAVEKGKIPMSDYPFHKHTAGNYVKIGTAGSWVRPSTGYSFYYISKYVHRLIEAIKTDSLSQLHLLSKKTRWLDSIFLEVLDKENAKGPLIFEDMYTKNAIQQIFAFLDGETSIWEDMNIIMSFKKMPFLKGLMRYVLR